MNPATIVLRLLGIVFVAASFFVARILMVFPGLPLEIAQNHDNVLHVMDTYIEKMKAFRDAVATYDEDKIRELITEANKIKKILR